MDVLTGKGDQQRGEPEGQATWPLAALDRPTKIVCIGKNWAEHAKELGSSVPKEPILFLKPPSALIGSGEPIRLPAGVGRVDHEVELGVVVGRRMTRVTEDDALDHVRGWCLALDVTARDMQAVAKQKGRPWAVAKGYDTFCPVSALLGKDRVDPSNAELLLKVNGEVRQQGTTQDMVWSVAQLLAHVSSIMTLEPGDLVLTGTPSGVGPLQAGDRVEASLDHVDLLHHEVVQST